MSGVERGSFLTWKSQEILGLGRRKEEMCDDKGAKKEDTVRWKDSKEEMPFDMEGAKEEVPG